MKKFLALLCAVLALEGCQPAHAQIPGITTDATGLKIIGYNNQPTYLYGNISFATGATLNIAGAVLTGNNAALWANLTSAGITGNLWGSTGAAFTGTFVGNATLTLGALTNTGNETISGNLTLPGSGVAGNFSVTDQFNFVSANLSGNLLGASGAALTGTWIGNATLTVGTLTVTSNLTESQTISGNNGLFTGSLTDNGTSVFNGNTTQAQTLTGNNAAFSGILSATGSANNTITHLNTSSLTITGNTVSLLTMNATSVILKVNGGNISWPYGSGP